MPSRQSRERMLMRRALVGPDACRGTERVASWADGSLQGIEGRELDRHAAECYVCRGEAELLFVFEDASERYEERQDVERIAARLRASRPAAVRSTPKPRFLLGLFTGWSRGLAFAAVAAVFLAVGVLARRGAESPLPSLTPAQLGPVRSQSLVLQSPAGDQAQAPAQFRWEAARGAARYDLVVTAVDGSEIWRTSAVVTSVAVPAAVRAAILPGRTLVWRVVVRDAAGRTLSESEERFRVIAPGGTK